MTDKLICSSIAFCLFFVVLYSFTIVFEKHVFDTYGVECKFYTFLIFDEEYDFEKLLKIADTVLIELVVVKQHPLSIVVPRLLFDVFGTTHTFC
jgi:hypothetical protein